MAKTVFKTLVMTTGLSSAILFTGISSQAFAMTPFQASYHLAIMARIWVLQRGL